MKSDPSVSCSHFHVTAVGKVEVLLLLLLLRLTKAEVAILCNLRSGTLHVLGFSILVREVLLDDVVCLHVNFLVGVVLAVVNLFHAAAFFDEESVAVDGFASVISRLLVHFTHFKDILKTVESDLDNLVVRACKQVTQGLDAAHLNEESDLSRPLKTARGGVGDGPASLLSGLEVAVLKEVNERLDDVCIDDGLDLSRVAGSDVGDGPAGLFADTILSRAQKRQQSREGTAVDNDLSLDVIASDYVANGSKGGGLDGGGSVHQKLDEAARDTGLNNRLDLVVSAIRQVRNGPACVDEDFVVKGVHELCQDRKRGGNLDGLAHVLRRLR